MLRERTELYGVGDFDTHTAVQYNTIQYNSRTARKRTALAAAHASPRPVCHQWGGAPRTYTLTDHTWT